MTERSRDDREERGAERGAPESARLGGAPGRQKQCATPARGERPHKTTQSCVCVRVSVCALLDTQCTLKGHASVEILPEGSNHVLTITSGSPTPFSIRPFF